MNKKVLALASIGATLLLAGCPSVNSPLNTANQGASWVNIGVSTNNNILHELDKASIKKNGNIVTFKDRKTIDNLSKEHFVNVPEYKTSINTWQVNCSNRTFSLVDTQLFNKQGNSVYSYNYDATKRTFMKVSPGSAVEKQYNYVCNK
ncbi:surface-adhesin E family protein [Neisseria sp. Ec49-e6-T10]|uniref:surface-adhesin E family protein n=1 Tax=Neisseria sp. Ec49-e6-T10 TaxID=3140744 RepID=UPI003EB80DDF